MRSFFILFVLLLFGCNSVNYSELSSYSPNGHLQMVVEIPAGTNLKKEYDYKSNSFTVEMIDGKPRKVKFFPYLGNYGFIPSTLMDEERGGDGDALDIMVLSESVPTGSILEVECIGMMLLEDNGEIDNKILAIPVNTEDRILTCDSLLNMPVVQRNMLIAWFVNYKGSGTMKFKGWDTRQEAYREVEKWQTKE